MFPLTSFHATHRFVPSEPRYLGVPESTLDALIKEFALMTGEAPAKLSASEVKVALRVAIRARR